MKLHVLAMFSMAVVLVGCGEPASTNVENPPSSALVADDPYRLVSNVRPVAQQVTLNIDPRETDYSGSTTISVEIEGGAPNIRLHAEEMNIVDLQLRRDDSLLEVTHESGEHGLLTITTATPFTAGTYELHIEFDNDFNTDGVGLSRTNMDGDDYIFTQFEAIDARRAFPCFDEPGFKFPWQLTMTVPNYTTPITNTPEVSVTENGESKTVVFDTTPPLSSYLIAVAVGPYEMVPIEGMSVPGHVAVPRGKSHLAAAAVETTPPLMAYLEDYFGQPYPFKKLDLIAVNLAFPGAMEHPGAVTYSDFFLLLDESPSASQMSTLIKITAHELAHQWFGNLVTMQWWNDLWLNESFADWMGDKAADAVYPEFSVELAELRTRFQIMNNDGEASTKPIRHDFGATDNFQDGIFLSYYKGKAVLGMFEDAVGQSIFRDGVIRYLRKFSRQNAEAADLWSEINAGAEFDLAGGMASFIDQPGMPLVTVTELGEGRFEFSQSRIVVGGEKIAQTWTIPLSFRYSVGDSVKTEQLIMDDTTELVILPADVEWILPNADQRGWFRWSVPDAMLSRLSEDASADLNVRERMGLLTNLWALLGADKLDGDEYLAAMLDVSADNDPDVLRAMVGELAEFRETFVTSDMQQSYANFIQALLSPVLDRIGAEPLPDDSNAMEELRPQVLLNLSVFGADAGARAVVDRTVERYLADEIPMSASVQTALRSGAAWGGVELFNAYRDRVAADSTSAAERRSLVRAIGSFRDPAAVSAVLDLVLEGEVLRAGDVNTVLARLFSIEQNNAMLLDWAMQNDAALRELLPEGRMVEMPGRLMTCSTDTLDTISEFYSAPERFVGGIDSEIASEVAEKTACAEFRAREIDAVREYLDALAT